MNNNTMNTNNVGVDANGVAQPYVINDIPDNIIEQNVNEDFFLVRDTLNNKRDLLNKKYEEYNSFKNILNTDDIAKNNAVFFMLGNKINDVQNIIITEKIPKDYSKLLDDKIKQYKNIMNNPEEDQNKSIIEKKLIIHNNLLEKQNFELRQALKDIMAKDIYSTPLITGEIKEKLNKILNDENYNDNSTSNPFSTFDDLLMMLHNQCMLNENQLNQN